MKVRFLPDWLLDPRMILSHEGSFPECKVLDACLQEEQFGSRYATVAQWKSIANMVGEGYGFDSHRWHFAEIVVTVSTRPW